MGKKAVKYKGTFVATATFNSRKVIARGNNPEKVRQSAVHKGASSPVVTFVPKAGTRFIF